MDEEMANWIRISGALKHPAHTQEDVAEAARQFPKLLARLAELEAVVETLRGMGRRIADFDRLMITYGRGD